MDYHPPHGKDGGPVHDWVDGKRQQPGRWPRIGETWDDGMPLDPWLPLFSSPTAVESPVELNFFEPVFVF